MENQQAKLIMMVTLVYTKCSQNYRLRFWQALEEIIFNMKEYWLVRGDFNVIRSDKVKLRGLPVTLWEIDNFNQCINMCNLEETVFKSSKFTGWNGRIDGKCIFKRLDRVFVNVKWQGLFPVSDLENLGKSGSYHAPLLVQCSTINE